MKNWKSGLERHCTPQSESMIFLLSLGSLYERWVLSSACCWGAASVSILAPQGRGMGRQDTGWNHHLYRSINPITWLNMPGTLQFGIKYSGYGEMYHETFQPGLALWPSLAENHSRRKRRKLCTDHFSDQNNKKHCWLTKKMLPAFLCFIWTHYSSG